LYWHSIKQDHVLSNSSFLIEVLMTYQNLLTEVAGFIDKLLYNEMMGISIGRRRGKKGDLHLRWHCEDRFAAKIQPGLNCGIQKDNSRFKQGASSDILIPTSLHVTCPEQKKTITVLCGPLLSYLVSL